MRPVNSATHGSLAPKCRRKNLGPDAYNVRSLFAAAAAHCIRSPDRLRRTFTDGYIDDLSGSRKPDCLPERRRGTRKAGSPRLAAGRRQIAGRSVGCFRLAWIGRVLTKRRRRSLRLKANGTGVRKLASGDDDVVSFCRRDRKPPARKTATGNSNAIWRSADKTSDEALGAGKATGSRLEQTVRRLEVPPKKKSPNGDSSGTSSQRRREERRKIEASRANQLSVNQRRDILLHYSKLTSIFQRNLSEDRPSSREGIPCRHQEEEEERPFENIQDSLEESPVSSEGETNYFAEKDPQKPNNVKPLPERSECETKSPVPKLPRDFTSEETVGRISVARKCELNTHEKKVKIGHCSVRKRESKLPKDKDLQVSEHEDKVEHCSVTGKCESSTVVNKDLQVSQDKDKVEHCTVTGKCESITVVYKNLQVSQEKDKVEHCSVTGKSESSTVVKNDLQVSENEDKVEHIPATGECETNYIFKKKLSLELLSRHTRRPRLPWRAKEPTMGGRGNEAPHLGFGFRGYSRTSQLGSVPLPEADNGSVLSTGMISESCGRTSVGTGRSRLAVPQSHAPLPRRTPQPQLMLPLRDNKLGGPSQHGDAARGEAFCLEGEQLIKPSGKRAEKRPQAEGPHISGYYRDALLRRGATLRPIAAGAFSSRLTMDAPTDVRSMMIHMSSVSDYVTTDFGFNPERARDDAGHSAQRFTTRDNLLNGVASSANKHIYVAQNSHMVNRNSRADDGIQNVRKTLYPFMEQRQDGHVGGTVSYRGRDPERPLVALAAGSRDLPIYDRQLWKRQTQQPKRAIRTERRSPIVLPPINVSKVSLNKDGTD